jgi:hypothetical protein
MEQMCQRHDVHIHPGVAASQIAHHLIQSIRVRKTNEDMGQLIRSPEDALRFRQRHEREIVVGALRRSKDAAHDSGLPCETGQRELLAQFDVKFRRDVRSKQPTARLLRKGSVQMPTAFDRQQSRLRALVDELFAGTVIIDRVHQDRSGHGHTCRLRHPSQVVGLQVAGPTRAVQRDGGGIIRTAFRNDQDVRAEPLQFVLHSGLIAALKREKAEEGSNGDCYPADRHSSPQFPSPGIFKRERNPVHEFFLR